MLSKLKKDLAEITSVPVYAFIKPEEDIEETYIEYRIISDIDADFAGNKNLTEIYTIQIDIFSFYDYVELARTVKNILKAKGYIYIQGDGDLYEPDTKLYHKAMRFKYSMLI